MKILYINEKVKNDLIYLDCCKSKYPLEVCKAFQTFKERIAVYDNLMKFSEVYVGYKIKKMKGKTRQLWELRLNIKYRIIFTVNDNKEIIVIEALNDHQNLKGVK